MAARLRGRRPDLQTSPTAKAPTRATTPITKHIVNTTNIDPPIYLSRKRALRIVLSGSSLGPPL